MDTLQSILEKTEWSSTPLQLQDLKDQKLPVVVRLADPDRDLGPGVDTSAPFLVYSRRRRTKVYAECLGLEKGKKQLSTYGPVYEIPKDYTGWFEVYPSSGVPPAPETSLAELTHCKQILVRSKLHGFPYHNDDINLEHELKIYPGEVLTVDRVVKKEWKVKQTPPSSLPATSFLRCRDFSHRDVCIPLAHPGLFNPVYDPELGTSNPENAAYQIADLLGSQFPVVVKLAFGWPPVGDTSPSSVLFTGLLQLVGLRRPDTLVLCNITAGKTLLLEVPLDIDLKLCQANGAADFKQHPAYVTLLKKCYAKVYQFVISIRAMSVKYPLLVEEDGRTYKRFSVPVDMDRFNPLEVFPPLEEDEEPGQSFQLSFRDPDDRARGTGPLEDLKGEETVLVDPHVTPAMLSGPRTTEAVRSNLHHMRQQYNRQREERESLA